MAKIGRFPRESRNKRMEPAAYPTRVTSKGGGAAGLPTGKVGCRRPDGRADEADFLHRYDSPKGYREDLFMAHAKGHIYTKTGEAVGYSLPCFYPFGSSI